MAKMMGERITQKTFMSRTKRRANPAIPPAERRIAAVNKRMEATFFIVPGTVSGASGPAPRSMIQRRIAFP